MELNLPPERIKKGSEYGEFRKYTKEFLNRSKANRERMLKYWSDNRHRKRVDKKQAKPVDVFDLEGHFIATYPSSRKARIGLGLPSSTENLIRACRRGEKRQYRGFQFRDHTDNPTDIKPLPPRKHKPKGYHVNRKPNTYTTKTASATIGDTTVTYPSIKELAKALGGSYCGIWMAVKHNRPYKGWNIKISEIRKIQ